MKTIKIRAFGPCSTETYQRDFDGFLVRVRREAFDGWNDLELKLPNGKKLPTSSKDFSLKQLGIEYDILDISSHSDIQHTVMTDINDDEIEEFIDECAGDDNWEEEWDFVDSDYIINSYELL